MIDTDKYEETDHPELVEFEGKTLGYTLTNLLAEVKRLREVIRKIKDCATINAQHDDIIEKREWEYILEMIE